MSVGIKCMVTRCTSNKVTVITKYGVQHTCKKVTEVKEKDNVWLFRNGNTFYIEAIKEELDEPFENDNINQPIKYRELFFCDWTEE